MEMTLAIYKLTNQDMTTRDGFQYTLGVTAHATGDGEPTLCSNTVLHAYTSPVLAVLMNPMHANIQNPRLFRAEGEVVVSDPTKVGVRSLTLVEEVTLPVIETSARVRWGISFAWPLAPSSWRVWAAAWLSGEDRSRSAAYEAAAYYVYSAAYEAAAYYATRRAVATDSDNAVINLRALDETDAETLARLTGDTSSGKIKGPLSGPPYARPSGQSTSA
jgi:hypothetical protein